MFSHLFAQKSKTSSAQKLSSTHKDYLYNLEKLLSDLGITFFKRSTPTELHLKSKRKAPAQLSSDLEKIALNQLMYSQIMEERMRKSPLSIKKSKAIVLQA